MNNRAPRVRPFVSFALAVIVAVAAGPALAQTQPGSGGDEARPATAPSPRPAAADQPAEPPPALEKLQEQSQEQPLEQPVERSPEQPVEQPPQQPPQQPEEQPVIDHPDVSHNPDAVPPPPTPSAPAQPPPAEMPAKRLRTIPPDEAAGVLGKKVLGAAGEDIGLVVDILIDGGGHPRAAVIDFGGFLGVGSRKIAVDWKLLQFRPGDRNAPVLLDVTRDAIQAAPEYRPSGDTAGVVVSPPEPEAPPAEALPEQLAVPEEPSPAPVVEQPAPAESDGAPSADATPNGPADGAKLQTKIPKDRPKRPPPGETPRSSVDPGLPPAPSAPPSVPATPPDARQ